jgi:Skp family chaperone for outer membrane proteins
MNHPTLSSILAVAAFTAAAAVPLAQAQTLNVARKVNRDELRYCMDSGDAIKARSDSIAARSQKVRAQQDELKAENEELKQEQEKQEKNSTLMGMGRDRLDRKVRAFNEKVAASRAEGEKLGPEADGLRTDLAAYNQRCAGITYDAADREAINKERDAAKK